MIQNHYDSYASPSPVETTSLTEESMNLQNETPTPASNDTTYVTLQLDTQSELLQRFIANVEEQLNGDASSSTFDIFTSDANSGYEKPDELNIPLTPENFPNSVVANEYSCSSNQTNKDAAMTDPTCNSDSSNTVQNIKQEEFILPSDEPYSYLQGLNSDNLMQFSQQSAIQELLLKEQLVGKPNSDILPTLEEHDIGGYNFDIKVCNTRKENRKVVYSTSRKKLYIRMNEKFALDAVYVPKLPLQQLRVRALISYKNEVSEPVLRCQNHLSKDNEPQQQCRESLLRCENPSVEYCGTAEGKSINERYSVVIPLGLRAMPKNDSSIGQTIIIKFTCQNSCIGRKETSIIFLLEGMSGEILSQRVIDVKICSCPRRDYEADVRNSTAKLKRKSSEAMKTRASKEIKMEDERSTHSLTVADEDTCSDWENSDSGISTAQDMNLQLMPSGKYRFFVELDKDMMYEAVRSFNEALALKIYDEPKKAKHYNKMCRQMKRYREKLQKV